MFKNIQNKIRPVVLTAALSSVNTGCETQLPCQERLPNIGNQANYNHKNEAFVNCLAENIASTTQDICAQANQTNQAESLIKISRLEDVYCSNNNIHGDGYSFTYVHCRDPKEEVINKFTTEVMQDQIGGTCIIQVDH